MFLKCMHSFILLSLYLKENEKYILLSIFLFQFISLIYQINIKANFQMFSNLKKFFINESLKLE